jgi:hypothetical protein
MAYFIEIALSRSLREFFPACRGFYLSVNGPKRKIQRQPSCGWIEGLSGRVSLAARDD